ncbi:MAG: HAMP domain-containing histidine kinase [Myxococcota bacterium]|nr:HAMP domain-containing histidine kinase [Myxococcota bacterium]MDW8364076.1 HAMP domain-containing sensor histidine kinase [Myxococcales bacterium]
MRWVWRSALLRPRLVVLLVPAIAVAAGILGYFAYQTAGAYTRLGEQAVLESTLLVVNEKVQQVERVIIDADNAVLALVDPADPESPARAWLPRAAEISPSVRAVVLLDDAGDVLAVASREDEGATRELTKLLLERILPDLALPEQPLGRLAHLHQSYGETSHLLTTLARLHRGRRVYTVLVHDTAYLVREVFPRLFATEEAKQRFNVVDDQNRRVYGPNLAGAGDYLVGRRFPTTLYGWRLQVAPKGAPELGAQAASRARVEIALVATAFAIVVLGVGFVLWAAEKERRLNALKAEFVANVSHELKTPLSVVRMFAEMLLEERVRDESRRRQYLETICREGERLSALVENVLDFAALESGRRRYELVDGDIGRVVEQAVETYRPRLEREGVAVSVRLATGLPTVRLDEQALLMALVNLLDNAVKHGGRTPVEVSVEPRGGSVEIAVRDHGPGIPRDDLDRVFERFYRSRRAPGTRGSGIGLSIVAHVARGHGGEPFARNAPDGGAVVGLRLPVVRGRRRTGGVPSPVPAAADGTR